MHSTPVPRFDDLALATGRSPAELEHELRVLLAVKLFELHRHRLASRDRLGDGHG